jgi:hypothetical protein
MSFVTLGNPRRGTAALDLIFFVFQPVSFFFRRRMSLMDLCHSLFFLGGGAFSSGFMSYRALLPPAFMMFSGKIINDVIRHQKA